MYEKPNPHSIDFNPEDSQDVVLFNKNDEYKIQHVLNGTYKNLNEEQKNVLMNISIKIHCIII